MSQEIFSVTQNYGSTLAIDGCDEHRWLNLSITDCDGTRTEEITLSPTQVGELVLALSDWFDVASRRGMR
jgi:hypothetical protein